MSATNVLSERASALSPTPLILNQRRQWSDSHVYAGSDLYSFCAHCGRPASHPDHVTREEDKAEFQRWRDRYYALNPE